MYKTPKNTKLSLRLTEAHARSPFVVEEPVLVSVSILVEDSLSEVYVFVFVPVECLGDGAVISVVVSTLVFPVIRQIKKCHQNKI